MCFISVIVIAYLNGEAAGDCCMYVLTLDDRQVLNVTPATSCADDVTVSNQSTLLSPERVILNAPASPSASSQHRSGLPD